MIDGQFDLSGYRFGLPSDDVTALVDGWDTGGHTVTDADQQPPGGDGLLVGRDGLTPAVWSFHLLVKAGVDGGRSVWDVLEDLRTVWRADSIRRTPGASLPLRYARDGWERVVYGRPRKFDVVPDPTWSDDTKEVVATFQLTDPMSYAAATSRAVLRLASSAQGWLVLPAVLPWTPIGAVTRRPGVVSAGNGPVPFTATFTGPVTGSAEDLTITSADGAWTIGLDDALLPGETVTVNTRSCTATDRAGASVMHRVAPMSDLSARLPTGTTEVRLTGADPSMSATCTLAWAKGFTSI